MPSLCPPHNNKSFGPKVSKDYITLTYNEILKQVTQIAGKDSKTFMVLCMHITFVKI